MNIYRSINNIITHEKEKHQKVSTIDLFIDFLVSVLLHTIVLFYLCSLIVSFKLLLYYDESVAYIDRSCHNITTHQKQQQQREGTIDILMAYFTFSFTFVPLLNLFSDNILYHCFYLQFLFINKDDLNEFQQYHKTLSATASEERYD